MLNFAWIVSIAANLLAAVAIRVRGLRYPWFEAWLWTSAAASLVLVLAGSPHTWRYFWTYVVTDPIRWLLLAAAVHEAYQLKMKGYRALSWAGSAVLWGALALAVILTAGTAVLGSAGYAPQVAQTFLMIRRLAMSILFVFAVATILFFRYFPAPSKRNLDVHIATLSVFLGGAALMTAGAWLSGTAGAPSFSVASLLLATGCHLAWALLLTRQGEAPPDPGSPERASLADAAADRVLSGIRDAVRTAKAAR